MRVIPGMTVVNPSDANSAKILLEQAVNADGPYYIRLGRAPVPLVYTVDANIKIGKGHCLRDGNDFTVIATGIMINEALIAASVLETKGISIRVIDMHTIKPLDGEIINKAVLETNGIVTAEEHSVIGGLGSAVAEYTAEHCPAKLRFIGQKDVFGESGKPDALLKKYNMTSDDIVSAIESM
jgi:transketolase